MEENKIITYSLLYHIRNSGTLIKGPLDVFIPLIMRVLSLMNKKGKTKGKNISEIKLEADLIYKIDFPLPVLKNILFNIANNVNKNDIINFKIFNDDSFIIKDYLFDDFEEYINNSKEDIKKLEEYFMKFCEINNVNITDTKSIFEFIDKNKISISKYLSDSSNIDEKDFTIEAKFINYFKKYKSIYDLIKKIYLGSIISGYLEYKTTEITKNVELIFDTNFIISLIDLNTPESTHTCRKLLEICNNLEYKFYVADITIEEIKNLINAKISYYNSSYLLKVINPEDIYNACERRKLSVPDLERISDNIIDDLNKYHIEIIQDTTKWRNIAKYNSPKEYSILKKYRNSDKSALHDATIIHYVKEKRGKKIKNFEDVNCWFVNNSSTHESDFTKEFENSSGYKSELIKADELLNIIWLSNPQINLKENLDDLADIGLSSLVAITLNESLPKASIIRELDENIQRFRNQDITDKDIINLSYRIVNRELKNISELNELAKVSPDKFNKRLKAESLKQEKYEKERNDKFEKLLKEFEESNLEAKKAIQDLKKKSESFDLASKNNEDIINKIRSENKLLLEKLEKERIEKIILENKIRKQHRDNYIKKEIKKWRWRTIIPLLIFLILLLIFALYVLIESEWKFSNVKTLCENNFIAIIIPVVLMIFNGYFLVVCVLKYHNHTNIETYKKTIEVPEEMKDFKIEKK